MTNENGGTLFELKDGRAYAVEDNEPKIECRLGFSVSEEIECKYAIIGSYFKNGKKYVFEYNDDVLLEHLLDLKEAQGQPNKMYNPE